MSITIQFTLHIQNREARDSTGAMEPWETWITATIVPRRDEWYCIPCSENLRTVVRARCGTPEHNRYRNSSIHVPLLLDTLSSDDAKSIGVEHEPWMSGDALPTDDAEAWRDMSEDDRAAFARWRGKQ